MIEHIGLMIFHGYSWIAMFGFAVALPYALQNRDDMKANYKVGYDNGWGRGWEEGWEDALDEAYQLAKSDELELVSAKQLIELKEPDAQQIAESDK